MTLKSKNFILFFVLFSCSLASAQNGDAWTEKELANYKNLKQLVLYVSSKTKSEISKDLLFSKFIYFDVILNDTVTSRKQSRLDKFDTIFFYFKNPIASVGLENFDAKPIRFFQGTEIYEPFGDELKPIESDVMAYYDKRNSSTPLGILLFESKTNKLVSWILINQGGYHYFLTFNML